MSGYGRVVHRAVRWLPVLRYWAPRVLGCAVLAVVSVLTGWLMLLMLVTQH